MRQLLYVSSSTQPAIGDALANILRVSRRNNERNGLTGLLWTDGGRFLQVLEGESDTLDFVLTKIRADDRHRAVVVLHDRQIDQRTFGNWSMALVDDSDAQIADALSTADPVVRGTFTGLIDSRRAAA